MCGIFGIIGPDSKRSENADRAFAHLHARGPDDRGVWHGHNAMLGMTRLAIVDLQGGHQPMFDDSGRYCIVFNGEIYNHVELREELEREGHSFRTHSDTEVLLALFCRHGERALDRLNGIFAFAVHDMREQRLFLARDRLGTKPLYISRDGPNLCFASSGTLLAEWLQRDMDTGSVLEYFLWGYVPEPRSLYRGIEKLGAGRFLWADRSGIREQTYWQPAERLGSWRGGQQDAIDQLDALLADALRLQVRSDVPIGVLLSGGVDSSAVLHYTRRVLTGRIKTFTIAYAGKHGRDAEVAREVATAAGADHQEIEIGAGSSEQLLLRVLGAMDEPFADTAFLPTFEISRVARTEGIKVLLSGAGGDEIFGGYSRHRPARPGRIRWFAELIAATGAGAPARTLSRRVRPDRMKRLLALECALVAEISGANFEFLGETLRDHTHLTSLLDGLVRRRELVDAGRTGAGYAYNRMLADAGNYLVNNVLALTDQATMGASVEGRVPLLDHRLVEFAYSLPPAMNLLGGVPKGLFRAALRGRVPETVLTRPKEGFNAPARSWIKDGLETGIARLLDAPAPILAGLLNRDALVRWLGEPRRRLAAADSLYSLVVFNEWWHRRSR